MSLVASVIDLNEMFKDKMYVKIKERLEKVRGKNKANIEDQVERIHTVIKLIQRKQRIDLNPNNPIAKEIFDRSIVRKLKVDTHTLQFKSKQRKIISKGSQIIRKKGRSCMN